MGTTCVPVLHDKRSVRQAMIADACGMHTLDRAVRDVLRDCCGEGAKKPGNSESQGGQRTTSHFRGRMLRSQEVFVCRPTPNHPQGGRKLMASSKRGQYRMMYLVMCSRHNCMRRTASSATFYCSCDYVARQTGRIRRSPHLTGDVRLPKGLGQSEELLAKRPGHGDSGSVSPVGRARRTCDGTPE